MKIGAPPLVIPCNLHQKGLKHLVCETSSPAATGWRYSSIFGAAVPLFEEGCEVHTSGWLDANICMASKRQYVSLQRRGSTDHGFYERPFCLVVRSCKGCRSWEITTALTKTDRTARCMVALCSAASIPLYITAAFLASGSSWCKLQPLFASCLISIWLAISQQLRHLSAPNQR